jgi:two-component system, OmpR family, sensor histidine kinase MtrB
LGTVLSIAITGVSIGLIVMTDYLQSVADDMELSTESVYRAEEVETALLLYNNDLFIEQLQAGKTFESDALKRERDILDGLKTMERLVSSRQEAQQVAETRKAVERYLETWKRLQASSREPLSMYNEATRALEPAYREIEEVVQLNVAAAQTRQSEVEGRHILADKLVISVIVLLNLLLILLLFTGQRQIVGPVKRLFEIVTAFGKGDRNVRSEANGAKEIREIGAAFNSLADDLERTSKDRIRFLASIAHDLRNPLGAIKMSADLMAIDSTIAPDERTEMLEIVSRQATRLDMMVNDLLDIAKDETGQLTIRMEKADLSQLISDSVRLYDKSHPSHNFTIDLPPGGLVAKCDPSRLSQVLNNLLSNAIKYSPYGGKIRIGLATDSGQARIEVEDQGIGMTKDEVGEIFRPFARASSIRDTIPGVGLGLATSKRLVELHNGKIDVATQKGKGSTFSITIPLA